MPSRKMSTTARDSAMYVIVFFVIVSCVIVSARCAAIADGIFVCKDLADNVIEALVCFEALLRDFVSVSLQGEVRELQLIGVIERILCAEVVFAALIGEVFFVCIHVRVSQRFRFPCRCYRVGLLHQ